MTFATAASAPTRQAQAANGNIEGIVRDTTRRGAPGRHRDGDQHGHRRGADVVDATTTASTEPSCCRSAATTIIAELQGFKTFEQQGVSLSAGQTALINVELAVGSVSETVTVTQRVVQSRSPARSISDEPSASRKSSNLPLVSRNPYNFAFLQANVTGYENNEFGVPRINANGTQMRTNYQLDGNTNTEKDRAGLRLLPVSEVLVREVKVITNGFAPEFGQTTGMVYNAITPSGTNTLNGSASFRFKPQRDVVAPPFFLAADRAQARHRGRTTSPRRSAARSSRTAGTTSARTSTSIAASSRAAR